MLVVNTKLKQLIKESGKTQGLLAKEVGIPEARLSRIIHGYITPRKSEEKTIARILGILTIDVFPPQL
ncbi:MAG: hypothetical protein A3C43_08750 [Candidatus Schekmanbacteria bacterium RIFCSPHIGHO2_02_FULL_38_11]|uniref:HTH cro/C1-type domain-containing protein n=1 Tax=Candidatus Schekmanbacteria bacterium RIFCSPLOWO2_12_FULL_38_15 TaxID=1817883 RepID=A0A1F7SL91_9BACT|nr:MAG: hypothetical protein A2043_07080 [Candidatus Schekmanbacteria bacterium GWA2_38_9]OGL47982.1 MAG: hypothetical protein A3H37_08130 [Candidatus Schekmanbacteria bacterium RIFCSPLOWO2_02_FULL_38_14]OGL49001.1 MAG: hypothetical protein A3C43_08750 [Candidatus Schekmanbacteria bacterium RIFCSPHIGHO2_02_FULL_38_11]OGL54533.1 MAG: hypothetical protein A3G31_10260 [Candidatus Schekmanbacteria bacterium RIFCSPLOWO2_12_FULL_38_15]